MSRSTSSSWPPWATYGLFQALFISSICASLIPAPAVPSLLRVANGTFANSTFNNVTSSNGTFSSTSSNVTDSRARITNGTASQAPFANTTSVANATIPEAKIMLEGTSVITADAAKVTVCLGGDQCTLGCCSKGGYCGFGPDYCGPGNCNAELSANGTCAQLSECDAGGYPGYGEMWGSEYAEKTYCPLNVCCSKFGFCGTTTDFCGSTTWPNPSCGGSSATARSVGYYEGWNQDRPCDNMTPERIPIAAYTHLNFAFAYIDPSTYAVVPMSQNQSDLYLRFTGLKAKKPELKTWIAIGGWTFNDPGPTQKTFTHLAASTAAQSAFISSLLDFMKKYNFDGVDLDWEYPEATDRGGVPIDFKTYVSFLANLRAGLGSYGVSITLPASYWYLQHFDIVNLDKYVDFFNIMTYDIYGTWDKTISETGPYVHAHTNLSMIEKGLQLLWHNNIDPARVNLGLGFYGRSFTLADPSCKETGCEFSTGGNPGPCTGTSGILSYAEIASVLRSQNPTITTDYTEAVKMATWGNDQWIGYDDPETLQLKVDYANKHCMGGTMVWAVDLDTTYTLAGAVSGKNLSDVTPSGATIYPDTSMWNLSQPEIVCAPPCTFILPPSPLKTPVSVTWPPFRTSVLSSSAGVTYTSYTTITIEPFEISSVSLWPVTVTSADTDVVTFTAVASVTPPSTVVTFPGSVTLFPPTPIILQPGQSTDSGGFCQPLPTDTPPVATPTPVSTEVTDDCTQFYQAQSGDSCFKIEQQYGLSEDQFYDWNPDVGDKCVNGVKAGDWYCVAAPPDCIGGPIYVFPGTGISPVFFPTSHVVTIQPQPTVTITTPKPPPWIRYTTTGETGPLPTWEGTTPCKNDCGDWDCGPFGCPPGIAPPGGGGGFECGLFGCDGGCGILGCGGVCGLFGCGCRGCIINNGGGDGGGLVPENTPEDCSNPKPVEKCTVYVSIYTPDGQSTKTTESETACATSTACDKEKDGTTTTTVTSSASLETMHFTNFDPLPTIVGAAALAAIGSSIDSRTSIWGHLFAAPTETVTKPPNAIGDLCTPAITGAANTIYSYCDCGTSYGSTLPYIPSTTDPCDYTTLPAICRYGASPQQNRYYCNCEGYPHTLPTLTTPGNSCGYTSFPDPWPYTSTDSDGNVLACETSSVSDGKTSCSGDLYTATAAPPKPTEKPRCITGHTYMSNCLTEGDTMSVQIWERGVQVCKGAKNIFGASDQTEYKYDCGNGATAMVTDNGAKLVYKSSDGYETTITKTAGQRGSQVCGYLERANGNVIELKGFLFEYAFANDQCSSCGTAGICDFDATCPFDSSCS